jgi:polynucleotide 5'-kinase involved in rRNA processing
MDQVPFLKSQHTATQICQQKNMKVHRCFKKSLPMENIKRYIKPSQIISFKLALMVFKNLPLYFLCTQFSSMDFQSSNLTELVTTTKVVVHLNDLNTEL